jgi:hypothetical protein
MNMRESRTSIGINVKSTSQYKTDAFFLKPSGFFGNICQCFFFVGVDLKDLVKFH